MAFRPTSLQPKMWGGGGEGELVVRQKLFGTSKSII